MAASTRCLCGYLILAPEARVGESVTCGRCGAAQLLPEQVDFPCEGCGKTIRSGVSTVGMRISCSHCARSVFVPEPNVRLACPFCGVALGDARKRCPSCGEHLLKAVPNTPFQRFLKGGRPPPEIQVVRADRIDPNPFQPRERMNPEGLRKLTQSVARFGILVPLLVRNVGRRFQLIAGSRRLEAARRLGMPRVPVVARSLSDRDATEIAYLENIQREDLDLMERAVGFQNIFLDQGGLPQEEMARRLGLTLEEIQEMLRILEMPVYLRRAFFSGRMSLRQVRALAPLARDPAGGGEFQKVAQAVLAAGLSDEETESLARQVLATAGSGR